MRNCEQEIASLITNQLVQTGQCGRWSVREGDLYVHDNVHDDYPTSFEIEGPCYVEMLENLTERRGRTVFDLDEHDHERLNKARTTDWYRIIQHWLKQGGQ